METLIEQQRRYHEERERIVDTMVKELLHKKMSHRDHINSEHRTKILLDRYMESTKSLKELYEDKESARKNEIQALGGPNEFNEFYSRLKTIKEFYKKHPNEVSIPMSLEFEEFTKMRESNSEEYTNLVDFKDEEGYGKYLDLNECFEKYLNLKSIHRVDYITYLSIFDRLYDIPRERKSSIEYRKYVEGLLEYLYLFVGRIKPLLDLDELLIQIETDFHLQWEQGQFLGWPKETHVGALAHTGAHLDLSAFNSWEELATLGLDRLKSGLMALGLKCGGTLEERAKRLFDTKGKSLEEIDPTYFAKKKGSAANSGANANVGIGGAGAIGVVDSGKNNFEKNKEIAFLEAQVYRLADLLSEQRNATKENVTRKQARTAGEKEESEEEGDDVGSDSDDDDDDVPYNPKNLPLGWDGKPIPYWLYKLHGLNISYNCEICGNFTYKGPKAFQRHFAEWRHAHGMRCLGIPNTAHFANVTQIEDALQLWEKLKGQKTAERWVADQEEEFEDSMGNVVNKKTYDDLKRQGLL